MIDARSGIVVAGGDDARSGDDETALATVDGAPLLRQVVGALDAIVDEVVVSCREDQRDAFAEAIGPADAEVRFAVERIPDRGPAAGLRTGLRFARGDAAAVTACDAPAPDSDLLAYAFERLAAEPVEAVVPRVDGRVRPLCGVYDVAAARDACSLAIDRGERRLLTVLSYLDRRVVEESTVSSYADPAALGVDAPVATARVGAGTTVERPPGEAVEDPSTTGSTDD